MYRQSKHSSTVWRIRITFLFCLIILLSGGLLALIKDLAIFIMIFASVIYILAEVIYIPMLYKSYAVFTDGKSVTVNKGVIFKKSISVEVKKTEYTELFYTPLSRIFKIVNIRLFVAGSSTVISNFDEKTADELLEKAGLI